MGRDDLEALRFVGPATAASLADAGVSAGDVAEKRVSHEALLDAGVHPGVAARIRREHSLSWTFEARGDDLARRADQVRGLGAGERAWVAASSEDWTADADAYASTDGSGDPEAAEAAWRDRSEPTAVTAVDGVDDGAAARLAEAGITSVRSLRASNPDRVADALGVPPARVRRWQRAAKSDY